MKKCSKDFSNVSNIWQNTFLFPDEFTKQIFLFIFLNKKNICLEFKILKFIQKVNFKSCKTRKIMIYEMPVKMVRINLNYYGKLEFFQEKK